MIYRRSHEAAEGPKASSFLGHRFIDKPKIDVAPPEEAEVEDRSRRSITWISFDGAPGIHRRLGGRPRNPLQRGTGSTEAKEDLRLFCEPDRSR